MCVCVLAGVFVYVFLCVWEVVVEFLGILSKVFRNERVLEDLLKSAAALGFGVSVFLIKIFRDKGLLKNLLWAPL